MRWKFTVCRKQSTIVDDVSFHRTLFPLSFAAVVVVCCPNILILRGIPRCVGAKAWRLGRKNTTPSQVAQGPPSPSSLSAITPVGGLAKTQVSMYMIERSRLQKNDEIADVIAWECPKLRVDHWEEKTGKLIVTEIGSTIAVATMKVGRRGRPKQDGRLGRFVASSSWKFVTLVQINFTQQLQVLRIPSFGCHFLRVMAITFLNFLSCCLAQNFWRQSKYTSEIACAKSAFGREWYVSFHVGPKQEPIRLRFELRFQCCMNYECQLMAY